MRFCRTLFALCLITLTILLEGICSAQEETSEVTIRLANGVPVEGTLKSVAPEGLTVQTAKLTMVLPWKYLSTGTRWRYERPMLAELEESELNAGEETKAETDAAANTNQPQATN